MGDRAFDSGHKHGNFRNYYNFHSCDERLDQLPITQLHERAQLSQRNHIYIIDIGCNEGDLSMGVLKKMKDAFPAVPCSLLGIDLDPVLVERAIAKYCSESKGDEREDDNRVTFKCFDILSTEFDAYIKDFCSLRGVAGFDVVSCFSITMWVHLNTGDEGLEKFLTKAASLTQKYLIIEPQAWKSYKNAAERCRRQGLPLFPHYQSLSWRNSVCDDIASFVSSIEGMLLLNKSHMSREGGEERDIKIWGRDFLVFEKTTLFETDGIKNATAASSSDDAHLK